MIEDGRIRKISPISLHDSIDMDHDNQWVQCY